jgi:hypothetical protein
VADRLPAKSPATLIDGSSSTRRLVQRSLIGDDATGTAPTRRV